MKRLFFCNWFFIAKCIGHYGLDFVLANVLLAACCFCFLFPLRPQKLTPKSWTTLFTIIPFTNHFREWAHFIYFPVTNRYSTLQKETQCIPSLKLTASLPLKIGLNAPIRKDRIPTIHFQGLRRAVSFREGSLTKPRFRGSLGSKSR